MSDKTKADAGCGKWACARAAGIFSDYLNSHRCTPGDACIRGAHSGRQIDRFLRTNPDEAHLIWPTSSGERCAIAARYAPEELITLLQRDNDEVVRRWSPADSLDQLSPP